MYSIIRLSSDPSVIGVTDESQCYLSNNNLDNILITHWGCRESWHNIGVTPKDESQGEEFKLTLKANLTDFVSFTPYLINCYLVSEKTKLLLDKHKLKNAILFNVSLLSGGEKLNYFLLHVWQIENELVDYSQTILSEGILSNEVLLKPKDQQEFESLKSKYPFCNFKKTTLNDKFDNKIDLFKNIDGEIYISESLRKAFIQNEISGINILVNKGDLSKWPVISTN